MREMQASVVLMMRKDAPKASLRWRGVVAMTPPFSAEFFASILSAYHWPWEQRGQLRAIGLIT